jgi:hypothetical protein
LRSGRRSCGDIRSQVRAPLRALLTSRRLGVAGAIAAFVLLAGWHPRLPGLYYDEVFQETTALAFVKGGLGSPVAWVPGTEISLAGHPLPLMAQTYIGAVKTIAFAPVAAVAGLTPESVRFFTIGIAALALLGYAAFVDILFRGKTGIVVTSTLLLASDPSYVFYSKVDLGPSAVMFLCKAVALWQLALWWRRGRRRNLVVGALALGIGVYDKVNFLWIVVAVAAAALATAPQGVRERLTRRDALAAITAFVAGMLPLIVYNLSWPPRTLRLALNGSLHLANGYQHGGFPTQLGTRFSQLADLLDGSTIAGELAGVGRRLPLSPALAALAVAATVLAVFHPTARKQTTALRFVTLAGIFVLVASALTPGGSFPHHVLLAYPFPHIAVAGVAYHVWSAAHTRGGLWARRAIGSIVAGAIAATVALNVATCITISSRLARTGGRGNFSDAIYRLDDYLQSRYPSRSFVAVDWGMFQPLVALSQGELRGREVWLELSRRRVDVPRYRELLTRPDTIYVLHSPGATNFPLARKRFFAIVRRAHASSRLVRIVSSREGQRVFEVYRVLRSA